MTWRKFWKLSEQYFDRFYTVATVIMVLDVLNGIPIRVGWVFGLIILAAIGGMFCAVCGATCEPEIQATGTGFGPPT